MGGISEVGRLFNHNELIDILPMNSGKATSEGETAVFQMRQIGKTDDVRNDDKMMALAAETQRQIDELEEQLRVQPKVVSYDHAEEDHGRCGRFHYWCGAEIAWLMPLNLPPWHRQGGVFNTRRMDTLNP